MKFKLIIIGLLLLASIGMTLYLRSSHRVDLGDFSSLPSDLQGVLRPAPKSLQAFNLTGMNGQPLTLNHFKGKWTMLFFGYTYCPDICPTSLAVLSSVFNQLEKLHPNMISDTQVLFVSVDPKRDTPETLAKYMPFFDKRFMAATGIKKEIDNLARQIGAGYQATPEDESGNYLVSHTGSIFLVGPQARLLASLPFPHTPADVTDMYLKIRGLSDL